MRASLGGKAVRWIEANVVHGEGDLYGEPFILRADQRRFVWEWYELDPADGGWWYERGYLEEPKGEGKTMLLAALILCDFAGPTAPPFPNIPVAAASGEQAKLDGIYSRLRQVLEHDACPLKDVVAVYDEVIEFTDGRPGKIRAMPANGKTSDGGLPTLYVADEVQDWFHTAADAHERNENSTTKRRGGRSLSASTPGERIGDGSVGYRLHSHGEKVASGERDDPRFLYRCHRARGPVVDKIVTGKPYVTELVEGAEADKVITPPELEAAIREANPGADERKVGRLMRRFHEIPRHRFCRFHLAVWTSGQGKRWMDVTRFVELADPDRKVAPGSDIVVAFDGSYNHDSTAVIAQTVDGHWFGARAWLPLPGRTVDRAEVDAYIDELARTYRMRSLGCDPPGWHEEVEGWRRRYGETVVLDWPTHVITRSSDAVGAMYADVADGSVSHDGDPVLVAHVGNAVTKSTRFGDYIVKESPDSTEKIDLAVVAYVANDIRKRLAPPTSFASAPPPKPDAGASIFRSAERLKL